ncbi:hypothetical protein [Mycolicibacterium vanbaalenii]|uniref:hypothetical protein n=1 Tax=Mycolicibacterium vanbaalenii TaxID=110539 RepID=UPI001F1B3DBA|nr:hypothetical protein [Mycolicibacterium vanbaalenii]
MQRYRSFDAPAGLCAGLHVVLRYKGFALPWQLRRLDLGVCVAHQLVLCCSGFPQDARDTVAFRRYAVVPLADRFGFLGEQGPGFVGFVETR